MSTAAERKGELRRRALRARREAGAGASLDDVLGPLLAGARAVASYLALPSEPGVQPRPGWLLPVLLPDGDLDWAVYEGELRDGPRGLREPPGLRLGPGAVAGCDVVLAPALLVDRHGVRLGKGGGSYDRALARATGLTVALLADGELVEALPAEPHDVPVQAVATPSTGLVRLAR